MAAYASVLSLTHILDQLLQHPPRKMAVLDKAQIDSLLQNLTFVQDFLEDISLIRGEQIQALEAKIASSAYAAEDIIESRVVYQILENPGAETERSSALFSQDLQKVIDEIGSIKKDVMKIKQTEGIKFMQQPRKVVTASSFLRGASNSKNTMVGFEDDLIQIMEGLTGDQSNLQILSVVGMGGIGKTTLAKNVIDNPLIVQHFQLHAWVTISQQYSVKEILLGLLKDTGVLAVGDEEITQQTDDELGLRLHKSLFDRRYLVVMDDIWSIQVWDNIKRFFPDNDNGSRILVTTRLSNVADDFHSCTPHRIHFLDEDKSWALFCDEVFGQESCPPEFEEVGKAIVRNCRGLPLAIVAISGLAKSSETVEYWEYVANDTYTAVNIGGDGHFFEILSLSYKYLPVHLKPCFLYMAIFPEDCEISISRLVKLWVAEGILKPMRSRSLEEIAEDNLKDLIDRNLILVHDYGSNNKIKTCTIHDLLRDLSLKEAQKEKFLCVDMMPTLNSCPTSIDNERRLIIHQSSKEEKYQQQIIDAMDSASCTRSLICCELKSTSIKLPISFRLLRVLDIDAIYPYKEILRPVNSKYIAFKAPLFPDLEKPLESLSLPWNLQTLIISGTSSETPINLPVEIWEMPQLRHLKKEGDFYLPDPPRTKSKNGRVSWEDLTLVGLLPHLEVLKLNNYAVQGPEWNPVEGEFLQLKFLQINSTDLEEWIADSSHFPRLENLALCYVGNLKEIPYGIGEIPTLRSISLEGCSDSANSSAKEIQEEQQNLGNDDLRVHVHVQGSWKRTLHAFEGKRLFSSYKI